METGISRDQIVNELNRSAHGKLEEYRAIVGGASKTDPEFCAHLISWDFVNGQIKDSKIAIPVITIGEREFPDELVENSLAHLCLQPPVQLLKALRFSIESNTPARRQKRLESAVRRYLAAKESKPFKWMTLVASQRRAMKALYAISRCPMADWASRALFKSQNKNDRLPLAQQYVPGSVFADIANLSRMEPGTAAATIQKWHLSPLVVSGAMTGTGTKQEDAAVVQATMDQMSDTQLVTRARSLEKKGVGRDAVLKEGFRAKVAKATGSKKATLKTSVAAEAVEDDSLKTMLRELQEQQIESQKRAGRGIDGDWLVIADRSSSMEQAIDVSRHVAAAIAKFVSGKVWLVFCNDSADGRDVTGKTFEQINAETKLVRASGWTSIGVGLQWAIQHNLKLDGVAIVSDGGENKPPYFHDAHADYKRRFDKDLPVYFYSVRGSSSDSLSHTTESRGIAITRFDLLHGVVDYYSLPNLVQTMNASRFGVVEKIMACPLVSLEQVVGPRKEKPHVELART